MTKTAWQKLLSSFCLDGLIPHPIRKTDIHYIHILLRWNRRNTINTPLYVAKLLIRAPTIKTFVLTATLQIGFLVNQKGSTPRCPLPKREGGRETVIQKGIIRIRCISYALLCRQKMEVPVVGATKDIALCQNRIQRFLNLRFGQYNIRISNSEASRHCLSAQVSRPAAPLCSLSYVRSISA